MYANAMLGMIAQTSIHAGASASEAAVDLPIQREAHTDWPVILGSGMKGALRSHFEQEKLESSLVKDIFGPDTDNASEHAGALLVSDARLLLLPVRSMTSHVKWVTCPALVARLLKDLKRLKLYQGEQIDLSAAVDDQAISAQDSGFVYLEEFRFDTQAADLSALISLLVKLAGADMENDLKANLMVVSNDQFRHLCRSAIPVNAHIAIDSATKTVKQGALFYEESLPAETLMYACLSCTVARSQSKTAGNELLAKLKDKFDQHNFIQVGGNLTTGMGWFEVNWHAEVSHG